MVPLLYLLFFLSGAAGLMYESVWARYLGLFVGHEAYAQVLVLGIFLGGMSLGALFVSRRADRLSNPLRTYALVEVAVGLIGLAFHTVFRAVTGWAYDHVFPGVASPLGTGLLKWTLAGLLILPQSILLGTTFPLMAAGVLRRVSDQPGRILGWLYFTNSLGAALGVLVAGFVVVVRFGLPGVLHTAAILNLVVGVAALGLTRTGSHQQNLASSSAPTSGRRSPLRAVLLAAAFLTAMASFGYEVDWIRMLSLVLGSATHSFELMLSAFILGLALGSAWMRRRADHLRRPLVTLAVIQILMGVLAVATFPVYLASFSWMVWLERALAATDPAYVLFTVIRYGFCLAVMLPATVCAGMTLPLLTRILYTEEGSETAIGKVYGWNTFGSILGAVLAAMALLPLLGLRGLLLFAGLVDIGTGALLLAHAPARRPLLAAPVGAALLLLAVFAFPVNPALLVSGVYRGGGLPDFSRRHVDYYADGRTATVAVVRSTDGVLAVSTNGKVDASLTEVAQRQCDPRAPLRQIGGDQITQLLTAIIPMGYLQGASTAALVGIGSGISTHTLLANPDIREVQTIEIEPRMVEAARLFSPANRRAFADPRSHIVIGDARAVFAASRGKFDAIISEPSNPWVSGVSALFTEEYYRRVAAQLTPNGVFAQWLQTYELDDLSVLRVLAAIDRVFPDWRVHQAGSNDLLILATPALHLPAPKWEAVAGLPELRGDFCGVYPLDRAALEATLLGTRELLRPAVLRIGAPNSDFFPLLDLVAERRRFKEEDADAFLSLGDRWFNAARQLTGERELPAQVSTSSFLAMRRSIEQLSRYWQSAPDSSPSPSAALARIRFEWQRWQQGLGENAAPVDWQSWVSDFHSATRFRHAGTAGWTDEPFFAQAMAFAERHHAPAIVPAVIRFRRAAQRWNAEDALTAAEEIRTGAGTLADWINPQDLLDGVVVSAVSLRRTGTAQAWISFLGRVSGRDSTGLIGQMLAARLDSAATRAP